MGVSIMYNNKLRSLVSTLMGGAVLFTASAAMAEPVLEYKVAMAEDGETYEVWMRSSKAPKPDISLTGQLTLRVPSDASFKAIEVENAVEGADWIEASRVDAPAESPEHDYISFSFVGLQGNSARGYRWEPNKERLVFTFKNEAGCVDGVSIIAADDPFNVEDNSANTNPGNQFTNLGWGSVGENNFKGTYGDSVSCST